MEVKKRVDYRMAKMKGVISWGKRRREGEEKKKRRREEIYQTASTGWLLPYTNGQLRYGTVQHCTVH